MVDYLLEYLRILVKEMPFLLFVAVGGIAVLVLRQRKPGKRDDAGSRALGEIARRAEAELRSRNVPFTSVTSTWSYGWPKVEIEFASPEHEASARSGEALKSISRLVYEGIRAAPELSTLASKIDPDRTVWLTVKGHPGYRRP